jgi:tetratricopeptide (TPR) repeat protein
MTRLRLSCRAGGSFRLILRGPARRGISKDRAAAARLGTPPFPAYKPPMTATAAELIAQGLSHHRAGNIALAMDRYTEVLRNDPRNADALYYIAVLACQEGQYSQGIDLARRSLAFRNGQARAHNLIGQALHRQGKIVDALAAFDDAIACDIKFTEAYGNRANMLIELGRAAEAVTSFDRAIELDPNSVMDWINRGAALHGLGRAGEAIASYDRALALDPEYPPLHLNRANLLHELGRCEEALAGYDRAITFAPDFARAHLARGFALKALGRLDDALAAVDEAARLEPDVAAHHKGRAAMLAALGRNNEARATEEKAAALERKAAEKSKAGAGEPA